VAASFVAVAAAVVIAVIVVVVIVIVAFVVVVVAAAVAAVTFANAAALAAASYTFPLAGPPLNPQEGGREGSDQHQSGQRLACLFSLEAESGRDIEVPSHVHDWSESHSPAMCHSPA